jgi:hypothetical protein
MIHRKRRLRDARDFGKVKLREANLSAITQYTAAKAFYTEVFHFAAPFAAIWRSASA